MFFAWGQCERNTGRFYEINFGSKEHRWDHRTIDSRQSRFTNKALIAQDLIEYGKDSDYVRVRIRGLPPVASELQFIDRARILAAQQWQVRTFADDPLIAGFDPSGGGTAWNVVRFRRGMDARTIPPIRIPGVLDVTNTIKFPVRYRVSTESAPGVGMVRMLCRIEPNGSEDTAFHQRVHSGAKNRPPDADGVAPGMKRPKIDPLRRRISVADADSVQDFFDQMFMRLLADFNPARHADVHCDWASTLSDHFQLELSLEQLTFSERQT